MLETVTNLVDIDLVDLVFLLQEKRLILVAQHDCQPLPTGMKSSAFGVLALFVILGNYCDFFIIFSTCSPKIE